jgi:UDP-N-acetylglucosamine 2-epimerase
LKLWTCYSTRSEWGPLEPFINIARDMGVEVRVVDLRSAKQYNLFSYRELDIVVRSELRKYEPDVVLCPFDRPEMAHIAYLAYHDGYPIAQTYAGDLAGGAHDDADRFTISNYATYIFTADRPQYGRMVQAMAWRQDLDWRTVIECVGPTAFDDMRFVPSPESDYALVLYNPPSLASDKQVEIELYELSEVLSGEEKVYWVEPNGDPRSKLVQDYAKTYNYLEGMDRPDFLGWLKGAHAFYGNSSAGFYEAPYFGVPFYQVGMRNAHREPISSSMQRSGASKRIIETLRRELE